MPDFLNIALSREDCEQLEQAAKNSRLSLVQWAKITLLRAAARDKAGGTTEPPRDAP